eukprot:COSAG01_NODE_2721_length_7186_cov_3.571328_4_plen_499_part_00
MVRYGEAGLLLMLVVLASVGLTVILSSVYPSLAECLAPLPGCVGTWPAPVGTARATDRSACCDTCEQHSAPQQAEACAAAVFLKPKCVLYDAKARYEEGARPLGGASLCLASLCAQHFPQHWLSVLLGASALLVRFGGLLFVSLMPKVLRCSCDYRCAGSRWTLVRWIAEDDPETAGCCGGRCGGGDAGAVPVAAAAEREGIHDQQQSDEAAEGAPAEPEPWRSPAVPAAASFGAIALGDGPESTWAAPSSWAAARAALGLSVRQARWSAGAKLVLWHWTEPTTYLALLGIYMCPLLQGTENQTRHNIRVALFVAWREVAYLLSTLAALRLNPAFLLMELGPVRRPEGGGWDGRELGRWAGYLLAPHHYVTLCLLRACGARGSAGGGLLCGLLLVFQGSADFFSFLLLMKVLARPAPPAALAFGLWLTTAGCGASFGFCAAGCLAGAHDRTVPLVMRILGLLGGIFFTCYAAWVAAVMLYATPAVLWFGAPCPSWVST